MPLSSHSISAKTRLTNVARLVRISHLIEASKSLTARTAAAYIVSIRNPGGMTSVGGIGAADRSVH